MLKKHWTSAYVISRLKQIIFQKKYPEAPWLTEQSVYLLDELINKTDVGLEYGSGRSTKWLTDRCKFLYSVEHHKEWYDSVLNDLADVKNVKYCFASLNREDPKHSKYLSIFNELNISELDFILDDGRLRDLVALKCLSKLKPGGLFILDNAERYLPNEFELPESMGSDDEVIEDNWKKFAEITQDWRRIWTTDGVSSTLIFIKSC